MKSSRAERNHFTTSSPPQCSPQHRQPDIRSLCNPLGARRAISTHMPYEEDLKAEIEKLRAENEALKKPARGQISLKVAEKGGLSVYGLGRFPVTLYREQWEKLLGLADEIGTFIRESDRALKKKDSMVAGI